MKPFISALYILLISLGLTQCKESQVSTIEHTNKGNNPLKNLFNAKLYPFYYGVASGDPLHDAVIIWTRIEPDRDKGPKPVKWEISKDSNFIDIVKSGNITTSKERDFTIKVDVKGLEPHSKYYYRFKYKDYLSQIGITKTAPTSAEELRFAVASCANYTKGFFNAYGAIAEEELNAVIFLGDYIYEYGSPKSENLIAGRAHVPNYELRTLADYRLRYALYRLDEDLQIMHKTHPFIAVWDDHEFANNAYKDGAQNHNEGEGDYNLRKDSAKKAYYEWLPIRETVDHYRAFNFGNLVDLIMLDERLAGRSKQLGYNNPERFSTSHSMLGDKQFKWLEEKLQSSSSRWKLVGSQVVYSYQKFDNPNRQFNMDSWNGYPNDQKRFAEIIETNELKNTIILSGDTHSAWAFESTINPFANPENDSSYLPFAVEFAVSSINSSNHNETFPDSLVLAHEERMLDKNLNPHLKYLNRRDHGFLLIMLNDSSAIAEYKIVSNNYEKSSEITIDKVLRVNSGTSKIINQE